jgi:hypothetical protein
VRCGESKLNTGRGVNSKKGKGRLRRLTEEGEIAEYAARKCVRRGGFELRFLSKKRII